MCVCVECLWISVAACVCVSEQISLQLKCCPKYATTFAAAVEAVVSCLAAAQRQIQILCTNRHYAMYQRDFPAFVQFLSFCERLQLLNGNNFHKMLAKVYACGKCNKIVKICESFVCECVRVSG